MRRETVWRVGVVCAGGVECGVRRTCRLRRGFVCAGFAWRGLSAAACIVNTVVGGAAVGGGSRMTDREKEESCGL